jgi:spore germination protein KB
MKQQPGKLGIREYVAIAILMVGSKATVTTPSSLFSVAKNAAWMVPLLSGVIFFVPLLFLMKTMSFFQDKDLFFVIEKLFGKYIGFLFCLIIFIVSSIAISSDSRIYTDIISAYYFNTTPVLLLYSVLMAVCAYGAKKGILIIGSVSYLVIFYVLISLYFALFLSTQDSNIHSMFPIWGQGKLTILKESSKALSQFSEFFLLAMLVPYFKSYREFQKGTWIAYVYVCIQISAVTLIFICMFDESLGGLGYPFHTAIRYISLGSYIPNIEIFFFVIWIMGAFIRFSAFLYISALMFGKLFKIKDFEFLIPSIAVIYLLVGKIPGSSIEASLGWQPLIQAIVGPMFAAVSVMIWLTALLKGEFKHANNKSGM